MNMTALLRYALISVSEDAPGLRPRGGAMHLYVRENGHVTSAPLLCPEYFAPNLIFINYLRPNKEEKADGYARSS